MPLTLRALAEDHAPLIGAAASVMFMSVSLACALAFVDISAPVQIVGSFAMAHSWQGSPAWNAPTPTTSQPGEVHADAVEGIAPAALAGDAPRGPQPAPPPAQPTSAAAVAPPVHPVPKRSALRRPARRMVPAEQAEVAPVQPRARLPSAPVARPRPAQSREPAVAGMITPTMLRHLSAALNLTPEQRALYLPIERQLLAIGAQQKALVSAGQDPKDAFSLGTAMSMYGVAQPFLNALSEDQKARVRAEARSMGFGFAAAQI